MNKFKEEFERKKKERRAHKSNTWVNFFIRLLILIFLILLIKTLGETIMEHKLQQKYPQIEIERRK
ncbi:MAG: hypothetical protein SVM86_00890 [Candidatus Cloacimonadota bacterium]|nr:hypothetical protein [Candidatus Cloacimonadota bacterium]